MAPFPGAPHDALYSEARQDGRPFFIIPWNDAYLIGTTDTRYDGNLDDVVADDADIAFLLARNEPPHSGREPAPGRRPVCLRRGATPSLLARGQLREASAVTITSTIMERPVVRAACTRLSAAN